MHEPEIKTAQKILAALLRDVAEAGTESRRVPLQDLASFLCSMHCLRQCGGFAGIGKSAPDPVYGAGKTLSAAPTPNA